MLEPEGRDPGYRRDNTPSRFSGQSRLFSPGDGSCRNKCRNIPLGHDLPPTHSYLISSSHLDPIPRAIGLSYRDEDNIVGEDRCVRSIQGHLGCSNGTPTGCQ